MSTGSDLEFAIAAAAKHYQAVDKCELAKQHTPRLHSGVYQGKASVDFKGWHGVDRKPFYLEAKATSDGHVAFADVGDGIREKQLDAMRDAVTRGIRMVLVIDFVREGEVYVIDVEHVVEFAKAPWRKSLSLHWARAYGEMAKVSVEGKHRRVWFLDTRLHDLHGGAFLAVAAERAQAKGVVVDLYPVEQRPNKARAGRFATRPAPGTEEHKEYVRQLADEGMRKAMGAAPKWNPKRRWAK